MTHDGFKKVFPLFLWPQESGVHGTHLPLSAMGLNYGQ